MFMVNGGRQNYQSVCVCVCELSANFKGSSIRQHGLIKGIKKGGKASIEAGPLKPFPSPQEISLIFWLKDNVNFCVTDNGKFNSSPMKNILLTKQYQDNKPAPCMYIE